MEIVAGTGGVVCTRTLRWPGGTLLVNDFWGAMAWQNLQAEMNRVLPGRRFPTMT